MDELTVEIDSFPNSMLPTDDKVAPMALFAFFYIASFPYSLPYYTVPKVPHLTVEDERKHLADAAKALHHMRERRCARPSMLAAGSGSGSSCP